MVWLSCIASNIALASLLAAAAWLVQALLGRPALARVLYVLALIKLVTPPLASLPLAAPHGAMACALGVCACEHPTGVLAVARETLPWVLLPVWLVGASVRSGVAWRRWRCFLRLASHANPAPKEWQALAKRLACDLAIRRPPELLAVSCRIPPLVVPGVLRPSIVLPTDLLDRLNESQRAAMLLHELAHVKRGDHVVRVLETVVGVVYWWLPIGACVGRRLRACEEACCDAAVVARLPHARRDYARLLLDVVDFADPAPRQALPHATAMSAASDLQQRVRAILSSSQRTRPPWSAWILAIILAFAILPCGLRYEVATRRAASAPAPSAARAQSTPKGAPSLSGDRVEVLRAYCCPG